MEWDLRESAGMLRRLHSASNLMENAMDPHVESWDSFVLAQAIALDEAWLRFSGGLPRGVTLPHVER